MLAVDGGRVSRRSRNLDDPTIPRKAPPPGNASQRARMAGPAQGRLVDYGGGTLVLSDMRGGLWPAEKIRYLPGTFGYNEEGIEQSPRPWLFAGDTVVVEGDWLLIHFLHGDGACPVIQGGIRTLKPADPAFFSGQAIGQDANRWRARKAARNPAGAITGTIEIRALDGRNALEIVVGGATFGTGVRLAIDYDAGTVSLDQGGPTERSVLGEAVVDALGKLATDLIAVAAAVPTAVPPGATEVLAAAEASLAAGAPGAPYLSSILRVQ